MREAVLVMSRFSAVSGKIDDYRDLIPDPYLSPPTSEHLAIIAEDTGALREANRISKRMRDTLLSMIEGLHVRRSKRHEQFIHVQALSVSRTDQIRIISGTKRVERHHAVCTISDVHRKRPRLRNQLAAFAL